MRKIPLLLISLLLCVVMVNAQKKDLSAYYPKDTMPPERQALIAEQKAINLKTANRDKSVVLAPILKNENNLPNDYKASVVNGKLSVIITCIVTPKLDKIISDAGGEIVRRSKEENVIVADVPADAIKKIGGSPDVFEITQVSPSPFNTSINKSVLFSSSGFSSNSSGKNFMSESVLKIRKQEADPKTAATN